MNPTNPSCRMTKIRSYDFKPKHVKNNPSNVKNLIIASSANTGINTPTPPSSSLKTRVKKCQLMKMKKRQKFDSHNWVS